MEHAEPDKLSQWIQKSTALLAPPADWEPNQKAARARFEARLYRQSPVRRVLLAGLAAMVITCMLIAAVPLTRVLAQHAGISWYGLDQFWYWITVSRTQQLVRLGRLPDEVKSLGSHPVTVPDSPYLVSEVAEAASRAGFTPRLPGSGMLPGRPRLSVLGPASFGRAFRTAELELALRQAQMTDQTVPAAWDGAWMGVQIGTRVTAAWSDVPGFGSGTVGWAHVTLAQSAPPVFALPRGIDLTSFAALNLRATLMRPESARRFAQYAVPAAALLVGDRSRKGGGMEGAVAARNVSLRHAPAILIEEWSNLDRNGGEQGPLMERISVFWCVPDRVYVLSGDLNVPLEMASYDLAGAIATVVGWANTID
jgi:hypothetical protein